MKAKIRTILNHNSSEERLVIDILEATDIGQYIILDTTYTSEGQISNRVRHPYWFPDQKVQPGDVVVLYTKKGNRSSTKNANGSISYFFFWGLDTFVWNNNGDAALLLHIDNWVHHRVAIG